MRATWTSRLQAGHPVPHFKALLHGREYNFLPNNSLDISTSSFFIIIDGSVTCTKEACNIRGSFPGVNRNQVTQVFGASEDNMKKHQKFIEKYKLPYPLIADP
jgi:peroxiredoxin Q/BCP